MCCVNISYITVVILYYILFSFVIVSISLSIIKSGKTAQHLFKFINMASKNNSSQQPDCPHIACTGEQVVGFGVVSTTASICCTTLRNIKTSWGMFHQIRHFLLQKSVGSNFFFYSFVVGKEGKSLSSLKMCTVCSIRTWSSKSGALHRDVSNSILMTGQMVCLGQNYLFMIFIKMLDSACSMFTHLLTIMCFVTYMMSIFSLFLQVKYAAPKDTVVMYMFYQPIRYQWRETDFFPCSVKCGGGKTVTRTSTLCILTIIFLDTFAKYISRLSRLLI